MGYRVMEILNAFITIIGLGAIGYVAWKALKEQPPSPPPIAPPPSPKLNDFIKQAEGEQGHASSEQIAKYWADYYNSERKP